jgi:ubiquinone/menaquinone biosynthesis C-methylase UbiE
MKFFLIRKTVEFLKQERLKEVRKHIKGKLLDIGCGDNILVKKLYKNGVGVDVYNYFNNVDLVVKSSAKIPLRGESFDTITIVAALNHIPKYGNTLMECYRLLKSTGTIIITMPIGFIQKFWHRVTRDYDDDQIFRGIDEKKEKYYLPLDEIVLSLSNVGFKNITTKKFLFGLNSIIIGEK